MRQKTVWMRHKSAIVTLLLSLGMASITEAQNVALNVVPGLTANVDGADQKNNINVSWTGIDNADEYQLEWYFENMYDDQVKGSGHVSNKLSFSDGATRVSIKGREYKIPNIYEKGELKFRVRAVAYQNKEKKRNPIYSEWCAPVTVTLNAHMDDKMNWQYIAAFAEEGKSKDAVSYYDGTMRSRQSVTRNSTNNDVLVGEVFYDERGRASIQTMPVPADAENAANAEFKFRKDFSRNESGAPYSKEDYAQKPDGSCDLAAGKMGTQSGASKYYSEENESKDKFNAYIPDAEGYPFSQVQYMNDNTGRVSRQGGVGAAYQIGQHDTKFYYATPAIEDLVRMFGREVGTDCHNYRKNMVVGPDGLTANTYLDKYGRQIATSLTGSNVPTGQDDISDIESKERTITILDFPQLDENQKVVFSEYYYLVPVGEASAEIDYSFNGIRFATEDDICFDCAYSIEIDMRDDCGDAPVIDGDVTVGGVDDLNVSGFPITIPFNAENAGGTSGKKLSLKMHVNGMKQGRYKITRRLVVDEKVLSEKVESYLTSTDKVKKLVDFVREAEATVDFSVCKPKSCEDECLAQAQTYEEYLSCLVACENPDEEDDSMDRCLTAKKLMINDFMPGRLNSIERDGSKIVRQEVLGGQYASYKVDPETGEYRFNDEKDSKGYYISIFSSDKFKEKFLIPDDITNESDQIKYVLDDFEKKRANNEAEAWAENLASKYHPEWSRSNDCSFNKESDLFDMKLKLIGSLAEAIEAGVYPDILSKDPYFRDNANLRSQMYLTQKDPHVAGGNYTLKELAAIMTGYFKGGNADIQGFLNNVDNLRNNNSANPYNCQNDVTAYYDSYWESFRSLYLSKKMSLNSTVKEDLVQTNYLSIEGKQLRYATYTEEDKRYMEMTDVDKLEEYKQAVSDTEIWDVCRNQAEAQVVSCIEDLKGCVRLNNSAFVWDENNDETTSSSPIAKAFVKIMTAACKQSMADATNESLSGKYFNMFGNSSITSEALAAYNAYYVSDRLNENYVSFRAVMDDLIGSGNYSYDCNPDLVSEPRESGNYLFDQTIKPLDGCGCDRVLEIEAEFNRNFSQLPLNLSVSSEVYMENKYGFSVKNYQQILCACKSVLKDEMKEYNGWRPGIVWSDVANTRLKETELIIPAELACEKCVTCNDIAAFVGNWNPTWCQDGSLQINSGSDLMKTDLLDNCLVEKEGRGFVLDSLSVQKVLSMRKALTNALNNYFQSSYLFESYQKLYNDCEARASGQDVDTKKCEVTEKGGNLVGLLEEMLLKHYLTGDRTTITNESTQGSEGQTTKHEISDRLVDINDKYGVDGVYGNEDGKVCDESLKPFFDKLQNSDCLVPVYTVTSNPDNQDPSVLVPGNLIVSDSSSLNNSCMVDANSGEWVKPKAGDTGVLSFTLSNLDNCPIYVRFVGHASDTKDYKFRNVLSIYNPRLSECSSSDNNVILANADLAIGGEVVTVAVEIYADAQCLPLVACTSSSNADEPMLCKEEGERLTPLSCEEDLRKMTYRNAEEQYEEYISEVRRTLMGEYRRTCMRTKDSENMQMKVLDREYHFTLYYYDLAGNLVRTVPPAGVELLSDEDVEKVIEARRKGLEPDVYTKHRMQTLYNYNSLNQLVEQYMPDHDAFSTVTKAGNGLPNNIKVVSTSYSDGMNGVLTAIDPSNSSRSIVYITHDGGENWVQSNNLKKNHYNDIAVNGNVMYLVGDGGAMLRSDNRGETWTVQSSGTTEDIIFIRTYGSNEGYFFTSVGNVYRLSSNTWTKHANVGMDEVYDVVYDEGTSKLYAVGRKNGKSVIAYTTINQMTWKTDVDLSITGVASIVMTSDKDGYALAEDGVMLQTSDGGITWNNVRNVRKYKSIKSNNGSYMATTDEANKLLYGSDIDNLYSYTVKDGNLYSVSGGALYYVSVSNPDKITKAGDVFPSKLTGMDDVNVKSFIYDKNLNKALFLTETGLYYASKSDGYNATKVTDVSYSELVDYSIGDGVLYILSINNGQKKLYSYKLESNELNEKLVANEIVSLAYVDGKFIMGDSNGYLYTSKGDQSLAKADLEKATIKASGFTSIDSDKDYTVVGGRSNVVLTREPSSNEWKLRSLAGEDVTINAVHVVNAANRDFYVGDSKGVLSHFVNGKWNKVEIGTDVPSVTTIDSGANGDRFIGTVDGHIYVLNGSNNQAKLDAKIRRIRALGSAGVWTVGNEGLLKKMVVK